jgi:hypothetical protein
MSTPTQPESYALSKNSQTALTNAANANFITYVNSVMADASSQGKYEVYVSHFKHVSFKDIATYFRALGYTVGVPRCPYWGRGFFGQYWFGYYSWGWWGWCRDRQICNCDNPCKIFISWAEWQSGQYGPCPWPWPNNDF